MWARCVDEQLRAARLDITASFVAYWKFAPLQTSPQQTECHSERVDQPCVGRWWSKNGIVKDGHSGRGAGLQ